MFLICQLKVQLFKYYSTFFNLYIRQAELYTDAKTAALGKEPIQVKDSIHLKKISLTNVKNNDPIIFPLEFRLEEQDTYQ